MPKAEVHLHFRSFRLSVLFQGIGWMIQSRGSIELIAHIGESQLFQHLCRVYIVGIVSGEEALCLQHIKSIYNNGVCSFHSDALSPKLRSQMKAKLILLFTMRTQSAAANQFSGG